MTIGEQVKVISEGLAAWAQENRGAVAVARDPADVLDALRVKPGGFRVVIVWDTEDPRGDWDELGRVDRGFKLVLSYGRGFQLESGKALTDGAAGGRALYDLVEEARELVRGLLLGDDEDHPRLGYRGSGPYEVQGFLLDAYEVRFGVGTQIPEQI